MADTKREIERKYESDESGLPDLTGVAGVKAVIDKGVAIWTPSTTTRPTNASPPPHSPCAAAPAVPTRAGT
jgi:hypothetical protein